MRNAWQARVTWGNHQRRQFRLLEAKDRGTARTIKDLMVEIVRRLEVAGQSAHIEGFLEQAAELTPANIRKALLPLVQAAEENRQRSPLGRLNVGPMTTLQEVGELLTSGTLRARFGDEVYDHSDKALKAQNLRRYVYPRIGHIPASRFTLDDARDFKTYVEGLKTRHRNGELAPIRKSTQRMYLHLMTLIVKLAHHPLKLLPSNPIPKGFVKQIQPGEERMQGILFPEEDAVLCAARDVPLIMRVFCGLLIREGSRSTSEARRLPWWHMQCAQGVMVRIRSKTGRHNHTAMYPGTPEGLMAWREIQRRAGIHVGDNDLVFPIGKEHHTAVRAAHELPKQQSLAGHFRAALRTAGVDRAELYASTVDVRPVTVHGLRASFATIFLALEKTEAWVIARTGHTDTRVLHRHYVRQAESLRDARALQVTLRPLVEAIPELAEMWAEMQRAGATGPTQANGASKPAGAERPAERAPVARRGNTRGNNTGGSVKKRGETRARRAARHSPGSTPRTAARPSSPSRRRPRRRPSSPT
jgi:integrase